MNIITNRIISNFDPDRDNDLDINEQINIQDSNNNDDIIFARNLVKNNNINTDENIICNFIKIKMETI